MDDTNPTEMEIELMLNDGYWYAFTCQECSLGVYGEKGPSWHAVWSHQTATGHEMELADGPEPL